MRSDGSMRAHSGTLILAMSCIQLANGFAMEGFDATRAGLVLSSYFSGFTLGACARSLRASARTRPAGQEGTVGYLLVQWE
jgi:hypothetical protein